MEMQMNSKCILLYAMPYSIEEENGSKNEGISVYYLPLDDLKPTVDPVRGSKGVAPCKQSVPITVASQLVSLPGIYDVTFTLRTLNNKPTLVPMSFSYVGEAVVSFAKDNK